MINGDLVNVTLNKGDIYTISNLFNYLLENNNELKLNELDINSVLNKINRIKNLITKEEI